jgi:haloacid dehalogenase-like hydrolase
MPGETAVVAITAPSIGRTDVGLAVSSPTGPAPAIRRHPGRRPPAGPCLDARRRAARDPRRGRGGDRGRPAAVPWPRRRPRRPDRPGAERLATLEAAGKTTVVLADVDGERPLGRPLELLAVADQLRPEATGTVADLHALGLRVAMLSGDHDRVASAIARQAGIDDWHANPLPEHKTSAIEELRRARAGGDGRRRRQRRPRAGQRRCRRGHGAAGTDVALETADLALMADGRRPPKAPPRRCAWPATRSASSARTSPCRLAASRSWWPPRWPAGCRLSAGCC